MPGSVLRPKKNRLDFNTISYYKQICEEWLIPKTTVNTIIREWQREGIIVLIPENRGREKNICLTDKGRAWAKELLTPVYRAEQAAMARTVQEFSPEFIRALEHFCVYLQDAFEQPS